MRRRSSSRCPADKVRRQHRTSTATRRPLRFRSRSPKSVARAAQGRRRRSSSSASAAAFVGRRRLALGSMSRSASVFPGQGSQTVGMGVDVAAHSPAARGLFDRARRRSRLRSARACSDGPEEKLRETRYSQPAIFVTNFALCSAVGDGLRPVVSAGHSFGEYCSLTLAGVAHVRRRAAPRERARARDAATRPNSRRRDVGGARARCGRRFARVVERVRNETGERVQLANFNAPGQIVISGD